MGLEFNVRRFDRIKVLDTHLVDRPVHRPHREFIRPLDELIE